MKNKEFGSVSVPEAGRLLGISRTTVWRLVRSGALPASRFGTRVTVALQDIEQFRLESRVTYSERTLVASAVQVAKHRERLQARLKQLHVQLVDTEKAIGTAELALSKLDATVLGKSALVE